MKKQGELFPHTPILLPNWDAPTQIKSVFTTKLHDPKANRTLAEYLPNIADLKMAIDPVRLDQTHSSIAHRIDNKIQGLVGDALVTCTINLPCSIDVADCVPVFLCDETGTEISVIHAGWRGLLAGVIENTTKIIPNLC